MTRLSKSDKQQNNALDLLFTQKPYTTITNNIEVTVWAEFIDSKYSIIGDFFIWAYHVRIDNRREKPIQLINRHWRIIDEKGNVQEVDGEGVVGEQPVIAPYCSYQYSSGIHLRHPSGIMTGKYQMKHVDGSEIFDVSIPTFSLDVPSVKSVIN